LEEKMKSVVSTRGQTAIPAAIRKRFQIKEKTKLEWIIEGDSITIIPIPEDPIKAFKGKLKGTTKTLIEERKREREFENRKNRS